MSHRAGRVFAKTIFRRAKRRRHPIYWAASAGLALVIIAGLVMAFVASPIRRDPLAEVRADAASAARALDRGDLVKVGRELAANRGNADFAYFFTSKAAPRALGDALGTVADGGRNASLRTEDDALAYDLVLTDLAGALAMATHGTGDRALPASWTDAFIEATTTPETSYGKSTRDSGEAENERVHQDAADKQNLLLLLSRGYWSTGFLKRVTAAYWDFDRANGDRAWPGPARDDAAYARAPGDVFLTDGIVALTAALTANPQASKWAFTDFQPGSKEIEGSDYQIGNFTHYLMFEHAYPEGEDGKSLGMTTTLTALASATEPATTGGASSASSGPQHDSEVLQAFAKDVKEADDSSCSWRVYDCVVAAAKAIAHLAKWVWERVGHWGHFALDLLALTTFAPPPVMFVGVAAATANAGWYSIQGDYVMAGVSLATAVPGLAFTKLGASVKATKAGAAVTSAVVAAKGATIGRALEAVSVRADKIARVAKVWLKGSKATSTELAEAGAKTVGKATKSAYGSEKELQTELAEKIPGAKTEKPFETNCQSTCTGNRQVDIFDEKTGTCTEVKTGKLQSNKGHELEEVEKDLLLLKNKSCKSVVWVFGPDKTGAVGPYDALRKALQKNGIPYHILKPAI